MNSQHTDVGAYSLGLLELQDRRDFEAHLAECQSCTAELAEFSAMADLLTGVGPVESGQEAPADTAVTETVVTDLIRRRATARRRRTRQQFVFAAAAGLVLLAGGVVAGIAAAPNHAVPVAQPLVPGHRHSAVDALTGVTGTVGLVAKGWGTQVTLELGNVRGPLECQLIAVSSTGETRVVTGWFVPSAGYGVPGHPGRLILQGGTSISATDLSRVVVEVVHGRTLLTIPV